MENFAATSGLTVHIRIDAIATTALAVEELDEVTLKAMAASRMDFIHDRLDPLMD